MSSASCSTRVGPSWRSPRTTHSQSPASSRPTCMGRGATGASSARWSWACAPGDDLFRAAIGGVGAAGVISQVTVQAVEHFNVEQKVEMSTQTFVRANLDRLIAENDHVSFYLYPFTEKCQINTWNRTTKPQRFPGSLREFLSISSDALLASWFGGFMAYTGLLPKWSNIAYGFKRGTDLVLAISEAYTRTIYHMHQELERS